MAMVEATKTKGRVVQVLGGVVVDGVGLCDHTDNAWKISVEFDLAFRGCRQCEAPPAMRPDPRYYT